MRYALWLESAYDNGKLCSLSHRAFRLWVNSLSYVRKHRTDGCLSPEQVTVLLRLYQLGPRDVTELVDKRGWEAVDGGYVIHDFLDVNPSEADLDDLSSARAEAGRRGGQRSGESRRSKSEAIASKQTRSKPEAKRSNLDLYRNQELEPDRDVPSPVRPTAETNSRGNTHNGAAPPAAAVLALPSSRATARPTYGADFEAWWRVYPRHEAKLPAQRSYEARRRSGRSVEALLAAATHLAAYVDEHATPTEKIPHATTFLNQHRDEGWEHGPPDRGRPNVNGLRIAPRDEPRGFQGIREAFADLMPAQEGA